MKGIVGEVGNMLASHTKKLSCLVDSLRSLRTSSVAKAKGGHRGGWVSERG